MNHGCIALVVLGLGTAPAAAQVPPPSVGPPDETVMHGHQMPSQSQVALTGAQKAVILEQVRKERGKPPSPINFVVSVGAPVPPSLELYILPDAALAAVPEAKIVKYTLLQNKIVLVDPTTMRVVDVIDLSS